MLRFTVDRFAEMPLFLQIKEQILEKISGGELSEGASLPPERDLAGTLGVNRSTVVRAYQDLKADGLLEARVGRGTIVTRHSRMGKREPSSAIPLEWRQLFAGAPSPSRNIYGEMTATAEMEDVISFGSGFPDPDLVPLDELKEIQDGLFRTEERNLFLPAPVEGYYPLRRSIAGLMERRDAKVVAGNVMVLSGSQQGLDFLARTFLEPGDSVVTEEPTFFGALDAFQAAGARILGIPTDGEGMRMDLLESVLARHTPKFIYVLPTFQNPSGITMPLARRLQLLDAARRRSVPVVEDDPYGELRYDGVSQPSLKSLDKGDLVIYLSTFSKTLFLSFRIGWIVAPREVLNRFARLKQISDLHVHTFGQMVFHRFLEEGLYAPHLEKVKTVYRKKRDELAAALSRCDAAGWEFRRPEGGYYFWPRLPDEISMRRLVSEGVRRKAAFLPGDVFFPDGSRGKDHIRLNFTHVDLRHIAEGIRRLSAAVQDSRRDGERKKGRENERIPMV